MTSIPCLRSSPRWSTARTRAASRSLSLRRRDRSSLLRGDAVGQEPRGALPPASRPVPSRAHSAFPPRPLALLARQAGAGKLRHPKRSAPSAPARPPGVSCSWWRRARRCDPFSRAFMAISSSRLASPFETGMVGQNTCACPVRMGKMSGAHDSESRDLRTCRASLSRTYTVRSGARTALATSLIGRPEGTSAASARARRSRGQEPGQPARSWG